MKAAKNLGRFSTQTLTTRYEATIGGDLALTITNHQVELALNNPHGDVVATVPLTGTTAGQGITGWAQYDEYGNPKTANSVNTGATSYGWHGADQRALDTSGLILMGARLYNPATGHFTTRDPIPGGNTTTYTYPQNPITMNDTTGLWGWGDVGKIFGNISTVVSFVPGWMCGLCGAVSLATGAISAISYGIGGYHHEARVAVATTVSGFLFGAAGRMMVGSARVVQSGGRITRKLPKVIRPRIIKVRSYNTKARKLAVAKKHRADSWAAVSSGTIAYVAGTLPNRKAKPRKGGGGRWMVN